MNDHLQFMCHLRTVDNQVFTKRRMSSDLIINAPPFLYLRQSNRLAFLFLRPEIKQILSSKSNDDRGAGDESGREHSNYSDFSA